MNYIITFILINISKKQFLIKLLNMYKKKLIGTKVITYRYI